MAASCTAGLPKLSKAMRGQTLSAWRKLAPSARLTETLSAAVCRECPRSHLRAGSGGARSPPAAVRMRNDEVLAPLTTCNRPAPLRSDVLQQSCD